MTWPTDALRQAIFNALDREEPTVQDVLEWIKPVIDKSDEIAALEKLVYVPGVWRCAKCDFRLIQSNLNANTGTVTARDTPGDKCPNCNSPLWRVTERQERTESIILAEQQFERAALLQSLIAEVTGPEGAYTDAAYAAELPSRLAETGWFKRARAALT